MKTSTASPSPAVPVGVGRRSAPMSCSPRASRRRQGSGPAGSKALFRSGGRVSRPEPPCWWRSAGLSGTEIGAGARAGRLAGPPPGAVIIRSDVVRKHLFGVDETTALPEAAYQADVAVRVYDQLSANGGGCWRRAVRSCSMRRTCGRPNAPKSRFRGDLRRSFRRPVPDRGSCDPAVADRAAQA